VDDYLASCVELGKEPCRPFKGSFNVRVTPDLHRQVAMAAADARESMNAWISKALEARVERQKTKMAMLDPRFVHRLITDRSLNKEYSRVECHRLYTPAMLGWIDRITSGRFPPAFERQRTN